ncbi:MAG: hypothetical protein GEU73_03600 [Chloroflexi bacterium]|nr:hypothetical protein [Chloroflexota bacterium]
MTTPSDELRDPVARDAANWAPLVQKLQASGVSGDAPNLVDGRRLVGPLQGFGQMWQKTYWVRLSGSDATPAEIMKVWRARFPEFWPRGNRFYPPLAGLEPGEVALFSVSTGPMRLSSGVLVLYADDESFTFMTPQGHMLAAWVTFSAFMEGGSPVAQAQVLMRAQDPIMEISLFLGAQKLEDRQWVHVLSFLARHFGVEAIPETRVTCVDPRRNWSQAKNVWHNAGIRSSIYTLGAPVRWIRAAIRR